jgi:hypothetical protein
VQHYNSNRQRFGMIKLKYHATNLVARTVNLLFPILAARLSGLEGDHPDIIDYIRKNKLVPAPPAALLTKDPAIDTTSGVAAIAMNLTRNKVWSKNDIIELDILLNFFRSGMDFM